MLLISVHRSSSVWLSTDWGRPIIGQYIFHGHVADSQVRVDVNRRPVLFRDPDEAPAVTKPYVEQANIVKVTEEEAELAVGRARRRLAG